MLSNLVLDSDVVPNELSLFCQYFTDFFKLTTSIRFDFENDTGSIFIFLLWLIVLPKCPETIKMKAPYEREFFGR